MARQQGSVMLESEVIGVFWLRREVVEKSIAVARDLCNTAVIDVVGNMQRQVCAGATEARRPTEDFLDRVQQ
eukprot:4367250-Prymnesium_polylepis.1